MKKFMDYYITTQRHLKGERNNNFPVYEHSWHIRNKKGEQLETSLDNEEGEQYYATRDEAMQQAAEAIRDHYN